jgi:hypothetical protein
MKTKFTYLISVLSASTFFGAVAAYFGDPDPHGAMITTAVVITGYFILNELSRGFSAVIMLTMADMIKKAPDDK